MNELSIKCRAAWLRPSLAKVILVAAPVVGLALPSAAMAQTSVYTAEFVIPADAPATTDVTILKSDGVGKFTILITNTGPTAVSGLAVKDHVGTGRSCPRTNPVTVTGDGVPTESFTIANLIGSGVTLGTLNPGQSATLTFTCQGK